MKIASVADVKARFSSFLRESEGGPVVVTRNGKPVGVLLAVTDEDDLESIILANSPRFQSMIEKGRQQYREGKAIPFDEFWKRVEAKQARKKPNGKARRKKS
jgi:prevent-host-death family protein